MVEGLRPLTGGLHGDAQHLLELALADVITEASRPQAVLPVGKGASSSASSGSPLRLAFCWRGSSRRGGGWAPDPAAEETIAMALRVGRPGRG